MKKSAIFLLSSALLFGALGTSCSSFMGSDAYSIENVTSKLNSDGSTTVTIEFTDGSDTPDYTFTIPGGNGIKDVVAVTDLENSVVKVTISFTDPGLKDYVVNLPIVKGPGIESITEGVDEGTGEKVMIISFTDGRADVQFPLPKGDKGNGINKMEYTQNEDKSGTIYIELDDGTSAEILIPAPERGVGVDKISLSIDEKTGKNIITFDLSDGTKQSIETDRSTVWYSGYGDPNDSEELGYVGDFYFEVVHYIIYQKFETGWSEIANLGNAVVSKKYNVSFNLNDLFDGGPRAKLLNNASNEYLIPQGRSFANVGISVPIAEREGYTFKGWFTESIYNVTLGHFTNMVPIYDNLKLFAIWEK